METYSKPQEEKTETELIAAILQEDIQVDREGLALRQPPIYGDDSDSWAYLNPGEYKPELWQYVAESVIRALDRRRKARNTIKKNDPDFFRRIGKLGGQKSRGGGFARMSPEQRAEYGRIGGMKSRRGQA